MITFKTASFLTGCSLFIFFVILAGMHIDYPGLYYDEVLFVNAATGGHGEGFLTWALAGIPIMVFPYIGALKSWIYFPIFHVFGVSPWTVRIPAILFAGLSTVLTFVYLKRVIGITPAFICGLMIASDPSFVICVRQDWGPVSVQFLLKSLSVLTLLRWLESGRAIHLAMFFVFNLLGIFDKTNFIWISSALIMSTVLVFYADLRQKLIGPKSNRGVMFVGTMMLAAEFIALTLFFNSNISHGSPFDFSAKHLTYQINNIVATVNGTAVYGFMCEGAPLRSLKIIPYLLLMALIVSVGMNVWFRFQTTHTKDLNLTRSVNYLNFFLVVFLIIFIQLVITKQATGPHHVVTLFPFGLILIVFFVRACLAIVKPILPLYWILSAMAIITVATVSVFNIRMVLKHYECFMEDRTKPAWTHAINDISQVIRKLSLKEADRINVVSMEWGLHNTVQALTDRAKVRATDSWFIVNILNRDSGDNAVCLLKPFLNSEKYYFVHYLGWHPHPPDSHNFERFGRLAKKCGFSERRVAQVRDGAGRDIIAISQFLRLND